MKQPAAKYTEADLERVLARDFPAEEHEAIRAALETYGKDDWQPEVLRVRMDCLKGAAGDAAKVAELVEVARTDYRDIIAWVEYRRFVKAEKRRKSARSKKTGPSCRNGCIGRRWSGVLTRVGAAPFDAGRVRPVRDASYGLKRNA